MLGIGVGKAGLLILAGLAVAPLFTSLQTTFLLGEALILVLFAMSLNLLVGTTGLVSFGHAAFYGLGAYAVALLALRAGWPPLIALAVTPLMGAIAGVVIGLVVFRGKELYFSLLTLGVAQLLWALSRGLTDFTGGANGVNGIFAPPWLFDFDRMYWFVLTCVATGSLILFVVTHSPFGAALRGIRENRRRAEFIGLWPRRYELLAFIISGALAAGAGGLFAIYEGHASSGLLHWRTSATPLIVSLLGGMPFFLGPVVGAIFYTFLQDFILGRTLLWDLVVGAIVLVVALSLPTGLCGALDRMFRSSLDLLLRRGDGLELTSGSQQAGWGSQSEEARREGAEDARAGGLDGEDDLILETRALRKSFGGLKAVDGVTLEVHKGSIHAIIGPNGAGKTTLFNVITGLLKPDQGEVRFLGRAITGLPPWAVVSRGIGRSFQQTTLFWELSALENVALAVAAADRDTYRMWGRHSGEHLARAQALLEEVGLGGQTATRANTLGHGDQRALELAMALASRARLLLLDEFTAGLSPAETRAAVKAVRRIALAQELTIVFIEHDMELVFEVSDWITVLHQGAVLASGQPEEVRASAEVQAAYLGDSALASIMQHSAGA